MELIWRAHRIAYQRSGGRIGARQGALPVLLLTSRGRKSGEPRTVALNYLTEGEAYVVFASHAGLDREPPWWLNLRDAGQGTVQIGTRRIAVTAREAEGEERERMWSRIVSVDGAYETYQKRTARRIAVVVLRPVKDPQST